MPEYLSPGVYVEEVEAGPKPIEGVSTSTAGAVGVTARGPSEGKPVLVTSFSEFVRKFGGAISVDKATKDRWRADAVGGGEFWTFPLAVKGFFDNGGQRLYVKRVVASGATDATSQLHKGVVASVEADAKPDDLWLKVSSLIGVAAGAAIKLTIDGNEIDREVVAYNAKRRTMKLNAAPGRAVRGGRDFFYVASLAPTSGTTAETVLASARSPGTWGNYISVSIAPIESAVVPVLPDPAVDAPPQWPVAAAVSNNTLVNVTGTITTQLAAGDEVSIGSAIRVVDAVPGPSQIRLQSPVSATVGTLVTRRRRSSWKVKTEAAAATQITVKDGTLTNRDLAPDDRVQIGERAYQVASLDPVAGTITLTEAVAAVRVDDEVTRLAVLVEGPIDAIDVWNPSALYVGALVEVDGGGDKLLTRVTAVGPGRRITLRDSIDFNLFEGDRVRLIEGEARVRYRPPESDAAAQEEVFSSLRMWDDNESDPHPSFFVERVNSSSALIRLRKKDGVSIQNLADFPLAVLAAGGQPLARPGWAALAGGGDNLGTLDAADFVGTDGGPDKRTGIQALEDIDEISICTTPSIWATVVQSALIQHCELLKDRFAVIDPRRGLDIEGIREAREPFDTKYAALYYPWIAVQDPFNRETTLVGPSSHVAGIYARVDVERGVHKAPGNEVIRGIQVGNGKHGLELEVSKREQDLLNPRGINALRFFPNRGTRVWGARTLSSDGQWKYINVRRLFIYVEESIDEGTQWVVFEPNDEPTWARVRQSVTNFLISVWRSGALQGLKQDEAFFVRCDRTTMTQDDIDNGRLICVIGIAPVKPAEFVIFRIQQKTLDAQEQA